MKTGTFVVLASGRGSNFQALLDKLADGYVQARCLALVTDNPGAPAIDRARNAGIPAEVVGFRSFPDKQSYECALIEVVNRYNPDLVVLAGYMRILGKDVVSAYSGRMINIHPSLLPAFPGLKAQHQAVSYGVKVAGCTVHFVTDDMDAGPIIMQRTVQVRGDDDGDRLSDRILVEEHIALPEAVKLFFDGKLKITGRCVSIMQG